MSSIEIDVKAKTGDAEKALLELTGDVDKLIARANRLQSRKEKDRRESRLDERLRPLQRKSDVGVKVINNNINDLGNSLNNLTELFESFADKIGGSFSDFYAKLQMAGATMGKLKATIAGFYVPYAMKGDPKGIEKSIVGTLKTKYERTKFDREILHATPGAAKMMISDVRKRREANALVTYRKLAFDLKQYMEFVEKRGIENVDWNEVRKEFGSCVYTIDD